MPFLKRLKKLKKSNEIIFVVEEDPDGGYNAQSLGDSIFIDGETINELKINKKDALDCHFENKDDLPEIIRLHFVREEIFSYA